MRWGDHRAPAPEDDRATTTGPTPQPPVATPAAAILALQRSAGNAAVVQTLSRMMATPAAVAPAAGAGSASALLAQWQPQLPSWSASELGKLAAAASDDDGGRTPSAWLALAQVQHLDKADLVASFVRTARWSDADVVALATARAGAPPAARKLDWPGLAVAHRCLVGNIGAVAALVAAAWDPAPAKSFFDGWYADEVLALLAHAGATLAARELATGAEVKGVGRFLEGAIRSGLTGNDVATLAGRGIDKGIESMVSAGWQVADIGSFAAAAIACGAPADRVGALIKNREFAGASFALRSRSSDPTVVGDLCGAGLATGGSVSSIVNDLVASKDAPQIQALTKLGLSSADANALAVAAQQSRILLDLSLLVAQGAPAAAVVNLCGAGWTPKEVVDLVANLRGRGVAVKAVGRIIAGPFSSLDAAWLAPGYRGERLGAFIGAAISGWDGAPKVLPFMAQAGSGTAIKALGWSPATAGQMLGLLLRSANAPTLPELMSLLALLPAFVRRSRLDAKGVEEAAALKPVWSELIAEAPLFAAHWAQRSVHPTGSIATGTGAGITVEVRNWLLAHVEQRHTYEGTDWRHATLNRAPGSFTFYPPTTQILPILQALVTNATVLQQASVGTTTQFQVGTDMVRVGQPGPGDGDGAAVGGLQIVQCFSTSPRKISSATLKAIGRLLGQPA